MALFTEVLDFYIGILSVLLEKSFLICSFNNEYNIIGDLIFIRISNKFKIGCIQNLSIL